MAQFHCDPDLTTGATLTVAERTHAGTAYRWQPGSDPVPYVEFVGLGHLVAVGPDIYRRTTTGGMRTTTGGMLSPHAWTAEDHVVVKPVAGDPIFLTTAEFRQQYAYVVDEQVDGGVQDQLDVALNRIAELELALADAEAALANAAPENAEPQVPAGGDAHEGAGEGAPTTTPAPSPRRPGRPKGSKNAPKDPPT